MKNYIQTALQNWKCSLQDSHFRNCLLIVFVLFAVQMGFISQFQLYIEMREGFTFEDPISKYLPILTLNWITFFAIYSAQLLGIALAFKYPNKFFQIILGYFFVYFFRIGTMYLLPLNPPIDLIPLKDPILIWFGNGAIINKDLFYSGHTSTTFMILLSTDKSYFKTRIYILIALIVVVAGIILQRVHYSVDVYSAFFFSYVAFRTGKYVMKKLRFHTNLN